jgi:hypothetical protein
MMGKRRTRFVAKPDGQGYWRVWDSKLGHWWGNPFADFLNALLTELNSKKQPSELVRLSKTNLRPLRIENQKP